MHFNAHFGYHIRVQVVVNDLFDRAQGADIINYRLSVPFQPDVYVAALAQRRIRVAQCSTLPLQQAVSKTVGIEFLMEGTDRFILDLVPLRNLLGHHGPAGINAQRYFNAVVKLVNCRKRHAEQIMLSRDLEKFFKRIV